MFDTMLAAAPKTGGRSCPGTTPSFGPMFLVATEPRNRISKPGGRACPRLDPGGLATETEAAPFSGLYQLINVRRIVSLDLCEESMPKNSTTKQGTVFVPFSLSIVSGRAAATILPTLLCFACPEAFLSSTMSPTFIAFFRLGIFEFVFGENPSRERAVRTSRHSPTEHRPPTRTALPAPRGWPACRRRPRIVRTVG